MSTGHARADADEGLDRAREVAATTLAAASNSHWVLPIGRPEAAWPALFGSFAAVHGTGEDMESHLVGSEP